MYKIAWSDYWLISAWIIFAIWLIGLIWTVYCLRKRPLLDIFEKKVPMVAEVFVSIIVPVRNEAHRVLEKSLSSILNQSYKNYELVVLNDCSTDETEEILRKLQAFNAKLKVINGRQTPDGWLGKPYALQQAFQHSQGKWILTTDADIIFSPEALQTALNYAEENKLDALTLMPKQICASFWEKLFMPVFFWFCLLIKPLHRANHPRLKTSFGSGNFFMLRRKVLEKTGGFSTIKNEITEDLKLAEIIKERGFRLRAEYAPNLIRTRMYMGFSEIWEGFTKNLFPALKFSLPKTIIASFWIFVLGVLPFFLLLTTLFYENLLFFIPLFSAYLLQVFVFFLIQREMSQNFFYAFLVPLGLLMFLAILMNSALRVRGGKGVTWKGRTIYKEGGVLPPAG
jgi:chlorobactene glucosyltransferase